MKKIRLTITIVFIAFIAMISTGSLLAKDREFSPNENRYLAEPPELTWDNLLKGRFQEDLENYLRDQVCFRDTWITIKTGIQEFCGNRDIGGAYIGRDGYDFEKIIPENVDEELFARNIEAVEDYFAAASTVIDSKRLSFLLVPTSGLILKDKLPSNVRLFDQSEYISQVANAMSDYNFIDVRTELTEHKDEYIYYRTDHHWTTDGAYTAYEKWCERTGHEPVGKENLQKNIVTEEFRGSLYSKILNADSAYDSIWTYGLPGNTPFGDGNCTVTYDNEETADTCYDASKLAEKDKYAYFFGGNYGEVHIANTQTGENGSAEKNLLIVKDSFANAFVPLIIQNYDNIYMVDLRYYNGDMTTYLSEHNITDVLILYNISNFIADKNIHKLTGATK